MNEKLGGDRAVRKHRGGGIRRAAVFPDPAERHATCSIKKPDRVAAPFVDLLRRQLIRPRDALARQTVNELAAGDADILPRRMVPGALAIPRWIKARFGVGAKVTVKDIIENRAQISFGLCPRIVAQPWLNVLADRCRIILAQMENMAGPIPAMGGISASQNGVVGVSHTPDTSALLAGCAWIADEDRNRRAASSGAHTRAAGSIRTFRRCNA